MNKKSLTYSTIKGPLSDRDLDSFIIIQKSIFGSCDEEASYEASQKDSFVLNLALAKDESIVGFKAGYLMDKHSFYSWMGGVKKDYREQGISSKLMSEQHEYLKAQGIKTIRTKSKNKWKSMMALNLKHGFDIIGTYIGHDNELKIYFQKDLFK